MLFTCNPDLTNEDTKITLKSLDSNNLPASMAQIAPNQAVSALQLVAVATLVLSAHSKNPKGHFHQLRYLPVKCHHA